MVKQQIISDIKRVLEELKYPTTDIFLSIPQNTSFGDYSTNIALQLAKLETENGKQSSIEIAEKILDKMVNLQYLAKSEIAGPGFLNFFIKPEAITSAVSEIIAEDNNFGKNKKGEGKKIQVEFISANPTGPLTLANGRGGTIGDTLANILISQGFEVNREYYVNDTGNQIRLLGESVLAVGGKIDKKEEHYQGEYIKELAELFKEKLDLPAQQIGHLLADYLLNQEIKPAIDRLGVIFDEFYSERSIYERDLINQTLKVLADKSLTYKKDGAVWFKSTEFGDEKDRVLVTSEESGRGSQDPTYFLADVAHHLDVLQRGYVKRINILGADHHGYVTRIKSAVEAAGFVDKVEIIFMQMVKLFHEGKEIRMSKRAGTFVTLDELLDAVGKDVARFFFLAYAPDSHIDFNLDLARERSNKNPVFYVQYAHARMSSILIKAGREVGEFEPSLLNHQAELALIKHLTALPDLIEEVSENYQVQKLATYAITLADLFHKFYESCRVLNAETPKLQEARLALVKASKIVLANTLGLMGVTAPEKM